MSATCNCFTCIISAFAAIALIILSIAPHVTWKWTTLTWIGVVVVPLAAWGCGALSRREKCKVA